MSNIGGKYRFIFSPFKHVSFAESIFSVRLSVRCKDSIYVLFDKYAINVENKKENQEKPYKFGTDTLIFHHKFLSGIAILVFIFFYPGFGTATEDSQLPEPIRDYYLAYNFLKTFSTPKEREEILGRLRLTDKKADLSNLDHRLQQIKDAIELLKGKLWDVDPGLFVKFMEGKSFRNAEILGIASYRVSEISVLVRVNKYKLTPKINQAMISLYKNRSRNGGVVSNGQRLDFIKDQVPIVELHFWFKVNERWVLNETKVGLLRK
jgi:hypothetical protein